MFIFLRPTAPHRGAHRRPQKPRPRDQPREHNPDKIMPSPRTRCRRRSKALPVFIDKIAVRPRLVSLRRQEVPRCRDQKKQRDSARQMQRPQPFPLVENQQPQEHHRTRDEKPDEPFRQRGQRRTHVEPVEPPPPPRARGFAHAQNKTKQRRAHQHRHRHVEQHNPRDREPKDRRPEYRRRQQPRLAPMQPSPRRVGEQHPRERKQRRRRPHRPFARPEEFQAYRRRPIHQRRLLEINHPIKPRRHIVTARHHLARDLRVAPFVGIAQRITPQAKEKQGAKRERQEQ